jgi:hypothetical protein
MADSHPAENNAARMIDEYFIENRTRLLDLAAFLDRLDRTGPPEGAAGRQADFRMKAFREALVILCSERPDRVLQIQGIFSDPTSEPLDRFDQKGACGAYDPIKNRRDRP